MSTNKNNTPSARKEYVDLIAGIESGEITQVAEPASAKGRGGRRSKADRDALAESSITYRPDAAKQRRGNPDGIVWSQLRLSVKSAASEGDKAQQREVYDMIASDGWDLSKVEEHWEVGSAWKEGKWRPVIDEMLEAMKNGELAAIYAYEVSRITRDPHVAKIIQQHAQTYNVPIRFVKTPNCHPEKNDAINEITYVVYVQQAKEESEATSARTKRNHLFRALSGRKRGGSEPMGMTTIWVELNADGTFTQVENGKPGAWPIFTRKDAPTAGYPAEYPTEASIVELMFKMAADGESSPAIARRLNELNVPTFGAAHWSNQTVKAILVNPVYAGFGTYKGKIAKDEHDRFTRPHRGFVAEKTWWNVQKLLEGRKTGVRNKPATIYRLGGTIRCNTCGAKMVGAAGWTTGKGRVMKSTYVCPTGTDNPELCKNNTITADAIEDTILELVCHLLNNPGTLSAAPIGNNDLLQDIETQLRDLGARIIKMRSKVEEAVDEDDLEAFQDKLDELVDKQIKLAARRELVVQEDAPTTFTVEEIRTAWNHDRIKVQRMIKAIFAGIRITKTTVESRMNSYQLADLGWLVNLHRVDVEFHNGVRVNLAAELGALLALELAPAEALVSA